MVWKNWPYWVRGGIIGIILSILLAFLIVPYTCSDFYRLGPAYPTDQPICYWLVVNGGWMWISILIFVLVLIIGLIYGKIKSKRGV